MNESEGSGAAILYRFRAEFRTGWRSVAVSVIIIGVALGASLTAFAAARRTATVFQRFVDATKSEDVLVAPNTASATAAMTTERLAALLGVETVSGLNGFASFRADSSNPYTALVATDNQFLNTVGIPLIRTGRLPDESRSNEVFATQPALDELGLTVGQTFSLTVWPEVNSGNVADLATDENFAKIKRGELGQNRTFTVVGVGLVMQSVAVPDRSALVFTKALYDETHAGPIFSGFLVRLVPGTDLATFEREASALTPGEQLNFQTTASTRAATQRILRPQVLALLAFGIVMAIAALASWAQLVARRDRLMAEDDRVLQTLGMSSGDRRIVEIARTFVIAVSAAVAAIAVGAFASNFMPIGEAFRIEPSRGFDFDALVLLGGAMIAMVGVIAIGAAVARRSAGQAEPHSEVSGLSRSARRLVQSPALTTGVSNALDSSGTGTASPIRSTLIGATAGVVVVSLVTTFALNLRAFVNDAAAFGWGWEATIYVQDLPGHGNHDTVRAVGSILDADPKVRGWATADVLQGQINGRPQPIMGISTQGGEAVTPTITAGRAPTSDHEVALGTRTARSIGVSIGDSVKISQGTSEDTFAVVGLVVLPGLSLNDADTATLGGGALVTLPALAKVFGITDPEYAGSAILVDLVPGASTTAFVERFRPADVSAGLSTADVTVTGPGIPSVSGYSIEAPEVTAYRRLVSTPIALAAILAVLAAATVGFALVASIRRRRRDFGILQALGFTRRQVRFTVGWHATTIAVFAAGIGVPLGVIAGRQAWLSAAHQIGVPETAAVPWAFVVLAPIVAIAAANIVAAPSARAAAMTSPAEALRDE